MAVRSVYISTCVRDFQIGDLSVRHISILKELGAMSRGHGVW
jgi:hypothetical protein